MKASNSKFAQCLYFMSGALARKVEKLAADSWKPVGLSPSHAYLLLAVLETPGIQPGALASQLQLQPSTITRLMQKLEEKKLIVRTTEGKLTNVYPTPKARELQPKMNTCMEVFYGHCDRLLNPQEAGRLLGTMGSLADRLDG
ncbi:MarR family transcriptional regulator [Flaviaesturariibacter flavus]|uniref:MarR family transcriptional regulator n=1 Tax=Flaviaesturariibacter flavus TaxID=2502780 RepID=A0A4R1BMU1_9BACT|nr:MarR family winged helix-turn-helix transcriptional regulator [Flaviaesturariibacter flavus]TCJ18840.1 MarR family transcriptional regulator [Flaviaesturariibacter flavus]